MSDESTGTGRNVRDESTGRTVSDEPTSRETTDESTKTGRDGDTGWRGALRAAGGLAAVGLAGCSTAEDDGWGDSPAGAADCDEYPDWVSNSHELHRARAAEFLLEQIRDGLPDEVIREAEAIGEAARESVVYLELFEDGVPTGHATGWFVEDGVIATNGHNIVHGLDRTDEIRGHTPDGASFETTIAGRVEDNFPDVAALLTDFSDASPLPVKRNAELEVGDPLVHVGHPGGFGDWVTCAGRFAGRDPPIAAAGYADVEFTMITTSIPAISGLSGSPVLDFDGEVVAMTSSAVPLDSREFGDPVRVAPDRLFDAPVGEIGTSGHEDVDVVLELVERWT